MIDTHAHLEQPVYDKDRDEVVEKCKREMTAVITCAAKPSDYKKTFGIVEKYPNFVFAVVGIHPEYVKNFSDEDVEDAIKGIEENRDKIVGIGETGLDYSFIKDLEGRERQKSLFVKFIQLAKRLDLPVVVHLRNGEDKDVHDVFDDAFEILEREGAKRVHLHMFGARRLVNRAINNGWYISMNAIVLRSKSYGKVVRDTPLDRLMLETDAPWLHPSGNKEDRNYPTGVRAVAEKIAEIKKVSFDEVVEKTTENASKFYSLN